ncbi:MAG: hypothetical protein AAFQ51_05405, partial [Pseudomonadota bacterium]
MDRRTALERAQEVAQAVLCPATVDDVEMWLAEMSVRCKAQKVSDDHEDLRLMTYVKELRLHPADCVKAVLTNVRLFEWFPALKELV